MFCMSYKKRLSRREREEQERQQRMRFWIGIFIIFVMVIGSVGFIATSLGTGAGNGGGLNYEVRDNQVFVQTPGGEVPFYNLPQGVAVPDGVGELLRSADEVVVAFNASDEENLQFVEAARWDLSNYLSASVSSGLLVESEEYSLPVVSCADATQQQPVIRLVGGSGAPAVTFEEEYCVTLHGDEVSILLARDALLYEYFELI